MTFSLVTNLLFYSKNEGEISILKELKDYKTLLVLLHLYKSENREGDCNFSLEYMIKKSGVSVNSNKGKSVDQFKRILQYLQDKGYLSFGKDMTNIKLKEFVSCKLNLNVDDNFTIIPSYVEEKIMNYDTEDKVDNIKLLFYWCYLNSRVYREEGQEYDEILDIRKRPGKPQTCYVAYEKINYDIGLTNSTIDKYNKILVKLNLLRYKNNGLIQKDKTVKESCNVYITICKEMTTEEIDSYNSLVNENLRVGLKEQMHSYKENGWNKTKSNKNNRSIAGKIGVLTRLKNENKATEEQLDELENLKALVEENRKYEASQKFKVGIVTKNKNKINNNQE